MKASFIILLTFLTSFSYAHQVKVSVNNNSFTMNVVFESPKYRDTNYGKFTLRDFYEFDDRLQNNQFKLPFKEYLIAIPAYSTPKVSITPGKTLTTPDVYPKSNSDAILEKLSPGYPEAKPIFEVLGYLWIREFYCLRLRIYTHSVNKFEGGIDEITNVRIDVILSQNFQLKSDCNLRICSQYDELISELLINSQIAEQFREKQQSYVDSTNSWIDYTKNYLKFCLTADGLYRINKSDLNTLGINLNFVHPNTLKIFQSGKEQSCYVYGEEDGSFDDDDYIEFWGTKNYSKKNYRTKNNDNEDYYEYLNRYTDTSFYFLTWGGSTGLRIPYTKESIIVIDTLDYYLSLLHFETDRDIKFINNEETLNQKPDWHKNKTWIADQITSKKPLLSNFSAPGLVKEKTAYFYSKLISYASDVHQNSHSVKFLVNGTTIDSIAVDRYSQCILQGQINSDLLNEDKNILSIENLDNGTKLNTIVYDWYECEYPRKLSLLNDSLYFQISNDVIKKPRAIIISNVKNKDYKVYKIRPTLKKIQYYLNDSENLILIDSVSGGDSYVISPSSKIQKPKFCNSAFMAKLRNETAQVDYIAITNSKFWNEALEYTKWISAAFSLSTKLINVQDIYDEFGYGYPDPQSIKNFLQYTIHNWKSPKPSYVCLIGDATYDYKNHKNLGISGNLVPSYGYPVSDNWFVIFDDNVPIPQMKLGRIPVNTSTELEYYLTKLRNNTDLPYNNWNKQFLFFSGGIKPEEFELLKSVNDSIINFIKLPPLTGQYFHFYKTTIPQSDFGPYSDSVFYKAVSEGGVFISYIGHSGTAAWDNSISEVNQLKNKVNRNPLITDFGCSTNKFAEPDITSFGEKFLLNNSGQALAYIGNSSLGFTNAACSAPPLFYESILEDSLHEIGSAHLSTKIKLLQKQGNSPVAKIFCYTNTLLGDPAVRLNIPSKPNLTINKRDVYLTNYYLSTYLDSVEIILKVRNTGLTSNDSVTIEIEHHFDNVVLQLQKIKTKLPENSDSIEILLDIKNKPGIHNLVIKLDSDDSINEIYETDNQIDFSFNVYSNELSDLLNYTNMNGSINKLCFLNPVYGNDGLSSITVQYADNPNFSPAYRQNVLISRMYTEAELPGIKLNTRYWFRINTDEKGSPYSQVKSFYNSDYQSKFLVCDSVSANEVSRHNITSYPFKLSRDSVKLSVVSSGWSAGANCVIAKQGRNLLGNTFFAGMGIVVFDEASLHVDTSAWYTLFLNPGNVQQLTDLINSIPPGKVVLMGVADDAANNISNELKNAIKTLGSTKIDQLKFRGSWALIGKKGAPPGCVIEDVKDPLEGSVYLDSLFLIPHPAGYFTTQNIGPASEWKSIQLNYKKPQGSRINISAYGVKSNGQTDFLRQQEAADSIIYIDTLHSNVYRYIKLKTEFTASPDGLTPSVSLLGVDYTGSAELGTNYQCVDVSRDTIMHGDSINIKFSVYNAGESAAGTFNVKLELVRPDNSSILLKDTTAELFPGCSKDFTCDYLTSSNDLPGSNKLRISIDPENNIPEMYKDNNVFESCFYIIADTTSVSVALSSLTVTFDGNSIVDGDYVSPNAELEAVLHYPAWFPVNDTSAVEFYLDEKQIFYSQFNISVDTSARKQTFRFIPQLNNGEHILKVYGINRFGIVDKIPGYQISFRVEKELGLFDVYNYPNPFSSSTSFTFALTQLPDQVLIKIYTVAGRLIRSIDCSHYSPHTGFNMIPWDGRDQDGDPAANGVYLYKVIVKKEDRSEQVIRKLAIIK